MLFRYSAARVIFAICSYLGTLLYSLILGPHAFGVIATLLTILTVAMGLDLGLNNLLSTHAAAAPAEREDVRAPVLCNSVLMLVTAIIYFILVPTLYQTLDLENSWPLSAVLLAYIASGTLLNPALNLALLEGKPQAAIVINGVHTVVRVLFNAGYFFLFPKSDISMLALGYLVINVAFNLIIIWLANFRRFILASISHEWKINVRTITLISPTVAYALASVTFANADKSVASYFLHPTDYGHYYLACALIMGLYALYSSAIGSYLIPVISRRIKASPVSQGPELVAQWMRFHVAALTLIYVSLLWVIAVTGVLEIAAMTYPPTVYWILSVGYFYNYSTLGYSPVIVASGRWRIPLEASIIGCIAWGSALACLDSIDVSTISSITAAILLLNYLYQWARMRDQVKTPNSDIAATIAPLVIAAAVWSLSYIVVQVQFVLLTALIFLFLHRTLRLLGVINK